MKIKTKLLITFLLITLIPLFIVSVLSIFGFQAILKRSIGLNFLNLAKEKAASIDYLIGERVVEVESLVLRHEVIDALREHSLGYAGLAEDEISTRMKNYDESIGALALGVVVPVRDKGEVVGIMKVNYKLTDIRAVISAAQIGETAEAFVVSSEGDMIVYSGKYKREEPTGFEKKLVKNAAGGWATEDYIGRKSIEAYFPIKSEVFTRLSPPGSIKGISGEKWKLSRWYVFTNIDEREAFAPIERIKNIFLVVGGLVFIAVILLAFFMARRASSPLEALTSSAENFGRGGDWQRVELEREDELGRLSSAFNEMADSLKESTVSRDLLVKEVDERKRTEEQIKAALKEKEVLLKEVHHRVKNNLQVVSSMLNLQSGHIDDEKAKEVFTESQSRIMSMALIHEMLYQSKNISRIDFPNYLRELLAKLFSTYKPPGALIRLSEKLEDVEIEIDTAIELGLIANELVTNSLKYAFPNGREGEIAVEFFIDDKGMRNFVLKDDGVGMPEGIDPDTADTLGLCLVKLLCGQLDGEMEIKRENGTEVLIRFPA